MEHWAWPQWGLIIFLLLRILTQFAHHGKPRLIEVGPNKGEAEQYNGFVGIIFAVVLLTFLIPGGFFS